MINHDPLCPTFSADPLEQKLDGKWICQCELIQRIRLDLLNIKQHEDEIEWEQGYKAGYEDAMEDCNMTYEDYKRNKEEWDSLIKEINSKREQ